MTGSVLVVDDDADARELLERELGRRGFEVASAESADRALQLLGERPFEVVVTDLRMPGTTGIQLCEQVARAFPDVAVIVITAFGSMDDAIHAIRAGAYDFITKPFEVAQLAIALERALQHRALTVEVKRLRATLADRTHFEELIGESPAMERVFELIGRVSESDSAILIRGETGTGKDLVARALHRRSSRREGPFVALNCAALPTNLLESELFGHTKGAFTDASDERKGLFLVASGGTLFLDEIGDMPLELQAKLLRALQERTVRPLGGERELPFDARIIAATHHDLEEAVAVGDFRQDLYYRLNVIAIELPPLRARGGDVLMLAQHFLTAFAGKAGKRVTSIAAEAALKLRAYAWPGNVRELQNCIEHAVAFARYEAITVDDLPAAIKGHLSSQGVLATDDPAALVPLDELERRHVARVMEAVGGNKATAARVLGVDRKTLYRKLRRHGITLPSEGHS